MGRKVWVRRLGLPLLLCGATLAALAQPYGTVPSATGAAAGLPAGQIMLRVEAAPAGGRATLGGAVVPLQEVTLSAQVPGRIVEITGKEGDWFEQGALLARIDDDDLLAQQRQALAALQNAQAALHNAGVQYSRELWSPQSRNPNRMPGMGMPSLFDQFFTKNMGQFMGYGNPGLDRYSDLYAQGTAVNQGQTQVLAAQSKLDEINAKLRDARTTAPFAGVIARKMAEQGDTIQPGQPILVFADIRNLQVKVDVPGSLMPGLRDVRSVRVRLDDSQKTALEAKVVQVFPVADPGRHTVTVKLELPAGAPAAPGMYAEVEVPDPSAPVRNLPVIPRAALLTRGSLPAVYVWNPERQQRDLRYLRLGPAYDATRVSVLSGLSEGETIVVGDSRPAP